MRLDDREIHVWRVNLDDDGLCESLLSAEERRKASRFHFEQNRRAYRVTHSALRSILGCYLGRPATAICIKTNPYGKPILPATRRVEFNLSHSGAVTLIALSQQPVGIDLERIDTTLDWQSLANVCCQPWEKVYIAQGGAAGAIRRFYEIWTRKEAYLKALGLGLTLPPESVDVRPYGTPIRQIGSGDYAPLLHVHPGPAIPGYVTAVGTPLQAPDWRLQCFPRDVS
ncbi:MAG: 4'-phosphopantetheinyl transferase superfamily protein [Nitrococcus sp.]|nr:4'-phosphopantetheinyl transferase superfamily protein [Nitrococcus sp.]